jgi:LysR family nitrogen assimilation transcriptional regulator
VFMNTRRRFAIKPTAVAVCKPEKVYVTLFYIRKNDGYDVAASIRDMRLFVAAYEECSFTGAAIREGATQSGVSHHIGNLEQRLGVRLFTRHKKGITTTPAANAYYRRCVEILRMCESAQNAVGDFASGLNGEVFVGLMPSMTRCVLAPALAHFMKIHPNVSVHVVEGYSGFLTRQVAAGELEFAIVPASSEMSFVRTRPFAQIPEMLISKKETGRTRPGTIRLASLETLNLVVPSKGNVRRHLLDRYLTSNRVRVHQMIEFDAMMGTLSFVADTEWKAILPAIMMNDRHDSITFDMQLIVDPPLTLELVLIEAAHRPLSRAAEALFASIDSETARLDRHNGRFDGKNEIMASSDSQ